MVAKKAKSQKKAAFKPMAPAAKMPKSIIGETSLYVQEAQKETTLNPEKELGFTRKEMLVTQFTAGGMVLSLGLSVGSVIVAPAWPQGGGLLATLGIFSCFGAFMARETI